MADNFAFLDGGGGSLTMRATDLGSSTYAVHKVIEQIYGSTTITASRATVTSSETAIVSARTGRRRVTLIHAGDGDDVYIKVDDATAVTTANGFPLFNDRGRALVIETQAAIAGIVASTSSTIHVLEEH